MNIQKIESLAYEYRAALDKAFRAGAFGKERPFSRFPHGCCDDVCDLFGQVLFEQGIPFSEVFGTYRYDNWDHIYSHVWLQLKDETVIDLTGDQYKNDPIMLNYNIPCYVGRPDQLHRLFQKDLRYRPFYGINNYDEAVATRLWTLHDIIKDFLNGSDGGM